MSLRHTLSAFVSSTPIISSPTTLRSSLCLRTPCLRPAPVYAARRTRSYIRASVDAWPTHVITVVSHTPDVPISIVQAVELLVKDCGGRVTSWKPLSNCAAQAFCNYYKENAILYAELGSLREAHDCDVTIQPHKLFRSDKKLAMFDLDSTLIQNETIDEIGALLGDEQKEQIATITDAAMNGELDFRQALEERVKILKGLHVDRLDEIIDNRISVTYGAAELLKCLRALGCTTCVVSGGFEFLAFRIRDRLGIDFAFANNLQVDYSTQQLTGMCSGDVVDAKYKQRKLLGLARNLNISNMNHVMAVGDGSNDLLMLNQAGLGIAFNAKPVVREKIHVQINRPSLYNVLYVLGLTDIQIHQLLETET